MTRASPAAETPLVRPTASPLLVALALGIVYVVWGSTYLAIRIMVEDLPPLLSAGVRFSLAGALLAAFLAIRSGVRRVVVTRRQLAACALVGLLLPAGGNGLVTIGEDMAVPSGLAALLIASVPLWVILLRAAAGDRPRLPTVGGVALGFAGLAGLVLVTGVRGDVSLLGVGLILVASMSWSVGSWAQPHLPLPKDPFVGAVYEMLAGGAGLLVAGLLGGESVNFAAYSTGPVLAWAYLVTFGSLVAFTAYVWVLQQAPISLVATYAYVNPVVAVALGWLVVAEPVTLPMAVTGAVVVVAVAVVIRSERATGSPSASA